ncbi:hypothetical protein TrVFT333_006417 [Trichoderma virens FT-333]|nr:hypothetical protein TrVFT333_006417 [Trichoderma virens FT-333]
MLLSLLTLAVVGYGSVLRSSADNTLDRNGVPNLRRDDTTQLFNVTGMAGLSAKCVQAMESPVSCSNDGMMLLSQADAISGIATPELLTADDLAATVYIPGTDAQESIFGGSETGEFLLESMDIPSDCLPSYSAISGSDGWCYLRVNEGLTQACDDCELGAFRAQMEDPGNYDADLAVQYTSQVSSCHKSLTPIATPTKSVFISSTIVTTTETCRGTMVPVAANANCDDFARTHSIGTEQLLSLNGLTSGCVGFPGSKSSLCVVGSCKTYTVTKDDTCSTIVKQAGIADVQFISWNPMLSPQACNRDIAKMVGHVVCISNPLGYTSPSNTGSGPVTTSSSMLGPVTGFDDLPDVSTIWTHAPVTTTTLSADDPFYTPTYELANGSISDCYFIYCGLFWDPTLATLHNDTVSPYEPKPSDATAGATDECYIWDKTPATAEDNLCTTFISYWGITIDQLYAWNPAVGEFLSGNFSLLRNLDLTPRVKEIIARAFGLILRIVCRPKTPPRAQQAQPPLLHHQQQQAVVHRLQQDRVRYKAAKSGTYYLEHFKATFDYLKAAFQHFEASFDDLKATFEHSKQRRPSSDKTGYGTYDIKHLKATFNYLKATFEHFKATLNHLKAFDNHPHSWNPVLGNACNNFWLGEAYCVGVSA